MCKEKTLPLPLNCELRQGTGVLASLDSRPAAASRAQAVQLPCRSRRPFHTSPRFMLTQSQEAERLLSALFYSRRNLQRSYSRQSQSFSQSSVRCPLPLPPRFRTWPIYRAPHCMKHPNPRYPHGSLPPLLRSLSRGGHCLREDSLRYMAIPPPAIPYPLCQL